MNEISTSNFDETLDALFKDKSFLEPRDLDEKRILGKVKQWEYRKNGTLNFLQFGKKVLYSKENLRAFFQNAANV